MNHLYDTIGHGYSSLRQPDIRIENALIKALGATRSVVNVGAGAGSYEPHDRLVLAVELSLTMIRQRSINAAPAVQASSVQLPFPDHSFDASLAILTIHHWNNITEGLKELRRVARDRVVILTWDPTPYEFWLLDYFPEVFDIDQKIFPTQQRLESALGSLKVTAVEIPHDCTDGFFGAYWRRPEQYLQDHVRLAISTFSKIKNVDGGLAQLKRDLDSGEWEKRYGHILRLQELDLGYRLVVATDLRSKGHSKPLGNLQHDES